MSKVRTRRKNVLVAAWLAFTACGVDEFKPTPGGATDGGGAGDGSSSAGDGSSSAGGSNFVSPKDTMDCSSQSTICKTHQGEMCCWQQDQFAQTIGGVCKKSASETPRASDCDGEGARIVLNCAGSTTYCAQGGICCRLTEAAPYLFACVKDCPVAHEICRTDNHGVSGGCLNPADRCAERLDLGFNIGECAN